MVCEANIVQDRKYDGYCYAETNLGDEDIQKALEIINDRWEIEERFKTMNPMLQQCAAEISPSDSIQVHLLVNFLSLLLVRLLKQSVKEACPFEELRETIKTMNVVSLNRQKFIPSFKRTALSDDLFQAFGFRTDYEIMTWNDLKKISTEQRRGKGLRTICGKSES